MASLETRALRAVLFDLDDTLWDLCATMERAHDEWSAAVRARGAAGVAVADAHADWTCWTDAAPSFATVKRERPDFSNDLTLVRREAMRRACAAVGDVPADELEALVEVGFAAWTAARNRPVFFPGALRTLATLRDRGLLVGAVSDGFADLGAMPELRAALDFAVFAREAGVSKPDARIFELALKRAGQALRPPGTVAPAESVMVGDSYKRDVEGAAAAGMRAVWLDNPSSFPRRCCGQGAPSEPSAGEAVIEQIEQLVPALFGESPLAD